MRLRYATTLRHHVPYFWLHNPFEKDISPSPLSLSRSNARGVIRVWLFRRRPASMCCVVVVRTDVRTHTRIKLPYDFFWERRYYYYAMYFGQIVSPFFRRWRSINTHSDILCLAGFIGWWVQMPLTVRSPSSVYIVFLWICVPMMTLCSRHTCVSFWSQQAAPLFTMCAHVLYTHTSITLLVLFFARSIQVVWLQIPQTFQAFILPDHNNSLYYTVSRRCCESLVRQPKNTERELM